MDRLDRLVVASAARVRHTGCAERCRPNGSHTRPQNPPRDFGGSQASIHTSGGLVSSSTYRGGAVSNSRPG